MTLEVVVGIVIILEESIISQQVSDEGLLVEVHHREVLGGVRMAS